MKMLPPEDIKKKFGQLLNLYKEKKNLLELIYEATLNCFNRLENTVSKDTVDEDTVDEKLNKISDLIGKRDKFIGQINEIDQQINTWLKFFDNYWPVKKNEYTKLPYPGWQLIEKEKTGIEDLLRKTRDKDYQISSHIKGMTAEMSIKLKDIQGKKYALKSYLPKYNQANGVFLDQKK